MDRVGDYGELAAIRYEIKQILTARAAGDQYAEERYAELVKRESDILAASREREAHE